MFGGVRADSLPDGAGILHGDRRDDEVGLGEVLGLGRAGDGGGEDETRQAIAAPRLREAIDFLGVMAPEHHPGSLREQARTDQSHLTGSKDGDTTGAEGGRRIDR